jgi:hypothetical protein
MAVVDVVYRELNVIFLRAESCGDECEGLQSDDISSDIQIQLLSFSQGCFKCLHGVVGQATLDASLPI